LSGICIADLPLHSGLYWLQSNPAGKLSELRAHLTFFLNLEASDIAYKESKKNGEFVLPGFGKLVKQKRKARTGFDPKTQQKIKIPAKTVVKFRVAKAAKDGVLGVKK
jgi:nucleoid DNA-binding protein